MICQNPRFSIEFRKICILPFTIYFRLQVQYLGINPLFLEYLSRKTMLPLIAKASCRLRTSLKTPPIKQTNRRSCEILDSVSNFLFLSIKSNVVSFSKHSPLRVSLLFKISGRTTRTNYRSCNDQSLINDQSISRTFSVHLAVHSVTMSNQSRQRLVVRSMVRPRFLSLLVGRATDPSRRTNRSS